MNSWMVVISVALLIALWWRWEVKEDKKDKILGKDNRVNWR